MTATTDYTGCLLYDAVYTLKRSRSARFYVCDTCSLQQIIMDTLQNGKVGCHNAAPL